MMNANMEQVWVDRCRPCLPNAKWRWNENAHLFVPFGTDLEVLHRFATRKLGLRRAWFQDRPDLPHYDLTRAKWWAARGAGALFVEDEVMVEEIHKYREFRKMVAAAQPGPITTPIQYHVAMARFEQLFPSGGEGTEEFELWAGAIEAYEKEHPPVREPKEAQPELL